MKKIICSFIALIMLFTVINAREFSFSDPTLTAHAASTEYVYNDYKYRHVNNGVEITGYIGQASRVYIPSYINGKKVVSIGENAFTLSNITYVKIPEGVTELKQYAFNACDDLVTVVLPKSLKSIRFGAFYLCKSLKNINIPSSVSYLNGAVFYRCENLTQITIPEGIDIIAIDMFYGCTSLNKVSLPSSLKAIAQSAFDGCTQLKNISIPRGVTTIEKYAFAHSGLTSIVIPRFVDANPAVFAGCENLKKISVDPNNKQYTAVNNVLYSKDRKKLYFYPFADVITVSNGVKVIEKEAFKMNKATKVVLPASVVSIKEGAFVMCANLQSVILPYNLKYIGRRVFEACYKMKNITIPASVTTIEDTAFKSIGHNAYYNLDILLSVYSDSVGYEYAMNNGFDYKLLVQEKAVRLNAAKKIVSVGKTTQFKATVSPAGASQKVAWRTGNSKIATVDQNGKVTAKSVGLTWLYAKTVNGKETRALVKIIPQPHSVKLNYSSKIVTIGKTTKFKATVDPANSNQAVTWRSSNTRVATVDKNGLVKAKGIGTVAIYAKTINGKQVKAMVKVIPKPKTIRLNYSSKMVTLGKSTKLKASIKPINANQAVIWRSSNTKVASVDKNGLVKAKGVGTADIYAKTSNGKQIKATIKVIPQPKRVKLNTEKRIMKRGTTYTFKATVNPTNANQSVTWRTGNSKIATVDKNGKVTAKSEGLTWLYVKTINGLEAKALIKIIRVAN